MTPDSRLGLIADGPEDGARAMARDEVLVQFVRGADSLTHVFRSHGWLHPTLTVGRGQRLPSELAEDAALAGIEVVRRPTGGGWLLHLPGDLALTFAVAGPLRTGELRRAARLTSQAIAMGLAACGQPAVVFTGVREPASRSEVCFMRADRDEVIVGATKVAGVALARLGRSALVQSALPLAAAPRSLGPFAERWDPRRGPALEIGGRVDRETVWRAAAEAMGQLLDAPGTAEDWPALALKRAEALRHHKYRDARFTRDGLLPALAAGDGEFSGT